MKKTSMLLIAGIAWFALALQLYLMLNNAYGKEHPASSTIVNFLSYFTILSNLLVAVSLTAAAIFSSSAKGKFFSRHTTASAIALYIFIVGLVYNLILRNLWKPEGLQLLADNLLHVIVPLTYLAYWFIYTPKRSLTWKDGLAWLWLPLAYLVYSLIRGKATGWYPYPFLNVDSLGYAKVAINCLGMLGTFLVAALGLIAIKRKRTGTPDR